MNQKHEEKYNRTSSDPMDKCSAPEWFSCPEGITPNSDLTGLNNTIYIYSINNVYVLCRDSFVFLSFFKLVWEKSEK